MPADQTSRSGNLFIISGPSGAGKGTLVRGLLGRVPDVWVSVSATTRSPRPGELEGVQYRFVSHDRFDRLIEEDGLLEWAEVHGNRYGTERDPVERSLAEGKAVILEIDPQGAMQVKKSLADSVLIFVVAPSIDELHRRLRERGSETEDQIEARMRAAMREMELAGMYDFVVVNDDVVRAVEEVAAIIDSFAEPAVRAGKD